MRRLAALTSLLLAVLAVPAAGAAAPRIVPEPAAVKPVPGQAFRLDAQTRIVAGGGAAGQRVALQLAQILRSSTGFPLPVGAGAPGRGDIAFALTKRARLGR